jgi:hypothetical protein
MSSFTAPEDQERETSTFEAPPDCPVLSSPPLRELHTKFVSLINASDHETILNNLLAADVRIQDSLVASKGLQGLEKVGSKLKDVVSKMGGSIQNAADMEACVELRDGLTTRSLMQLKKGMMKLSVGCSITWFGGMASRITLQRSAGPEFMVDDTSPPTTSVQGEGEEQNVPSDEFSPPYLIPRPAVFPPPTVTVVVKSASDLVNAPVSLRPVNPYIKLSLPSGPRHKTTVKKMTSNPTWGSNGSGEKFVSSVGVNDEYIDVQVIDWKPVKHRLLSEVRVSLARFPPTSDGVLTGVDLEVDMRWGKKGKKGRIWIEVGVVDLKRWWSDMERDARDERDKAEGGGEVEEEQANAACTIS